jgi:hypothetical protein
MWHWIKRLRDWAMLELWPLNRLHAPQALHHGYEKAGLTLYDQPIPWNAEAVLVEASLRLPPASRRKADFHLRLPGRDLLPAENLRADGSDDRHRVFFRFGPPGQSTTAELLWRGHALGQVALPVLSADEFLRNLRLQMPTLFVRIGGQSVACQTFVATQGKGLTASAVLTSPTSLAPVADLGLRVEFRSERDGAVGEVPVPLCSSQLAGRQALVTVSPRKFSRRMGSWTARWLLGDQVLASQRVRAISQALFQKSLRVSDTRFVAATPQGLQLRRQVPAASETTRIGPCFLISSGEPGMAGLCTLQVTAQVAGPSRPPVLLEQQVLITDGPTAFAPGTVDVADLGQFGAFELRLKSQVLGVLSLCPVPVATFNAEGGFKAPADFAWTGAADEELNDRISRLTDNPGG